MSDFLCHHQSTIEVGLPKDFVCQWLIAAPSSTPASSKPNPVVASQGETTSVCGIVTAEHRDCQPAASRSLITSSSELPAIDDLVSEIPRYDCLWCSLFYVLSRLCVDERPAVRKSAAQTLFSTIDAHGHLLASVSWNIVLWKVIYARSAVLFS